MSSYDDLLLQPNLIFMKQMKSLFLVLMVSCYTAFAQQQQSIMRYYYELTTPELMSDSPVVPYITVLDVAQDGTRFMSKKTLESLEKAYHEQFKKERMQSDQFSGHVFSNESSDIGWIVYHKDQQMLTISFQGIQAYKLIENTKDIKWILQPEIQNIADLEVQRATTHYAGRDWEAWFAPSIAVPEGPYKFNSLPGLVLKVSDSEHKFIFEFTHSELVEVDFWEPLAHKEATVVNRKQLSKAKVVAKNQTLGQMMPQNSDTKVTAFDSNGQQIELDLNSVRLIAPETVPIELD